MKKIFYIIGNVVFYVIIAFLLLFSIANLSVKKENQFPSILGRGFVSVLSDSMNGTEKDSFAKGGLVFVKTLNDEEKANLKVGDIVVFFGQLEGTNANGFIILRVVENYQEGKVIYTQGDVANKQNPYDQALSESDNRVKGVSFETNLYASVLAVYTGHVASAGSVIEYLRTPIGFALGILLPLAIFLIVEVIILVRYLLKRNKQNLDLKLESEKARIKQELLEELIKQQVESQQTKK